MERRLDRVVVVLFGLVVILGTATHEIWLDEAQHWCMARDSASLADLWRNSAGEGHPPLWHLLLWSLSRFSSDVAGMKLLHMVVAIAAVGMLVMGSPLPAWFRWTAPYGYFLAYEYAAIARNYAPGVLLLFIVCALHNHRRWHWRTLALAGLMLTHLWGLVVAASYAVVRMFGDGADGRLSKAGQMLVLIPFAVLAVCRITPKNGSPYGMLEEGLFSASRLERTFMQAGMAWSPLPDVSLTNPWNSHLLGDEPILLAWCGALLLALAFIALPRDVRSRAFFILCTIGILLFPWLTGYRGIRYTGPLVVAWIAAHWIGHGSPVSILSRWLSMTLLLAQVVGASIMLTVETRRPFALGTELAEAIAEYAHAGVPVVETRYTAGPVISAVLDRRLIYPTMGAEGSWCVWSRDPFMAEEDAIRRAPDMAGAETFVLLTASRVDTALLPGRRLSPIVCSKGGMIAHEDGCATLVGPLRHR
jgi:hypothetical protein